MTAKEKLNLGVSLLALAVSAFAAVQSWRSATVAERSVDEAKRAAAATERVATVSEEQVRPRVVFSNAIVRLMQDVITIEATIKNIGLSPALVRQARVDVFALKDGSKLGHGFNDLSNAILYPGDIRSVSLASPKRFSPDQPPLEVDYVNLSPADFDFLIAYEALGKQGPSFSEHVRFPTLRW
jgi:hypothetical protein